MRPTRFLRGTAVLMSSLLMLSACSDGDSSADSATGTTASESDAPASQDAETNTTGAVADEATASSSEPSESTESEESTATETEESTEAAADDTAVLCDGYLTFLGQGGVDDLAEALGSDAPPGVLEAIELTRSTDVDFFDLLIGLESLRGYVEPVCRDRWDEGLVPAASDQDAVNGFFAALVAGDRAAASQVAPDDVIANFEPWEPIEPDPELGPASMSYEGGGDFAMLLAPTVSVFCEVNGGLITNCLFGE